MSPFNMSHQTRREVRVLRPLSVLNIKHVRKHINNTRSNAKCMINSQTPHHYFYTRDVMIHTPPIYRTNLSSSAQIPSNKKLPLLSVTGNSGSNPEWAHGDNSLAVNDLTREHSRRCEGC